jgi:hypothetical protein
MAFSLRSRGQSIHFGHIGVRVIYVQARVIYVQARVIYVQARVIYVRAPERTLPRTRT